MVYIYEQTNGSITTLQGAAEPFVTGEDDSDDIFTPVRAQTGYLRVIDNSEFGTLLGRLVPTNNTQKLVRVYSGTWNTDYTNFVDGQLEWQGFLCAEAFTQSWDAQTKVIELPVKSAVAALADIQMSSEMAMQSNTFGNLICSAFGELGIEPSHVSIVTDLHQPEVQMIQAYVDFSVFFKQVKQNNEGMSIKILQGISYLDAISYFCALYGVCLRSDGSGIALTMYDNPRTDGVLWKDVMTWQYFEGIAAGDDPDPTRERTEVNYEYMLDHTTWRGSDNREGFLQGARNAAVVLNINSDHFNIVELPVTEESSSTVKEVNLILGKLYVQNHDKREGGSEAWYYNMYSVSRAQQPNQGPYYWIFTRSLTDPTYTDFLAHALFNSPTERLYDGSTLYTGATPVRYFYQESTQAVSLKSGLWLTQQTEGIYDIAVSPSNVNYMIAYKLSSGRSLKLSHGYLRLDMTILSLLTTLDYENWQKTGNIGIYLQVKFGSRYWNGSAWTNSSAFFLVSFTEGVVDTNKPSFSDIDVDGGYFIPVKYTESGVVYDEMEGTIELSISDVGMDKDYVRGYPPQDSRGKIVSDLYMEFVHNSDITASPRGSNEYRTVIMRSGFA
jgi:hypothetical protein